MDPRVIRRLVVPACFLLSGASALVYETVWLRQILLVVGTTTGAVSTVLGVFMLGLGLGALWIGARADRVGSPLRLYALLELGIGIYALLLPAIVAAATPLYVALARSAAFSPGLLTALRVAFGFALLLLPTLMMGATLPVLLRFAQRGGARFGSDLGNLYALNLAGAAAGSFVTGFVLIRVLGVSGAARVAVAINLVVALVAWLASRPVQTAHDEGDEPVSASAVAPGVRGALWATVFASGFATMGFEVLWARILVFSFQSTVYAFTVILATFLVGLALGSALYARLETRVPAMAVLAYGQLLAGVAALLLAPLAGRPAALLESFSQSLGKSGGTWVLGMALVSSLAMLIPATLMGTVFPLGTRLLVTDLRQAGHRVGLAYLVNTVGCVTGSLATGFLLIPALGLKGCLVAICALQATLGVLFFPRLGAGRAWRPVAAVAAVVVAALFMLRSLEGPSPFDGHLPAGSEVLAHHDDPGASVSVVRYPNGHRGLRIDGFDASTDTAASGYMAMMTHIPMLLHPDPKRLLVICFGTGRTAGSGLLHPEARVDVVDVNPGVFGFEALFRDANRGVAQSPRARLVLDDGRNFLLTSRDRYDVITSEPMPPRFAGVVNLYTREYYELARERLAPGGLVVQWLPVHLMSVEESLNVLRTVMEVFPETSLWIHRATGIIVSSRDPIQRLDVGKLARRMAQPELRADLAGLQVDGVRSFVKLYTLDPPALARLTAGARAVTDDRPSLEFHEVSHRRPELVGTHWSDAARALELLLRARTQTQLPLAGAEDAVIADLREDHAAASFAVLGDLYLELQRPDQAKLQYQAGAEHARRPRDRALFLFVLGDMAAAAGSLDEARRLLDAGLALWPDNARARELRQKLVGGERDAAAQRH
jgi:spermidine synthase